MPLRDNAIVRGLRARYPDVAGNPETATSVTDGPDPENAQGSPIYPAYEAPTSSEPFTSTKQIPYRGAEPHGVPFTPETHPDPRITENPSVAGQIPIRLPEPSGLADLDPVPVKIVEVAPDIAERKRFIATSVSFPAGTIAAYRLLNYRPNRTKARIWTKPLLTAGQSSVSFSPASGAGGSASLPIGAALSMISISMQGASAGGYEQFVLSGVVGGPLTIGIRYTTGGGLAQFPFSPALQPLLGQQITLTRPVNAGSPAEDIFLTGSAVTGRLWISQDESPSQVSGLPLDQNVGEIFETNTTEDLWAALDVSASAGVIAVVYEEFVTEIPPETKRSG